MIKEMKDEVKKISQEKRTKDKEKDLSKENVIDPKHQSRRPEVKGVPEKRD